MDTRILAGSVITLLLLGACGSGPGPISDRSALGGSPAPSTTPRATDGCSLTIPPQPGFVPPEPFPQQAPELYRSVWYGSDELWTMVDPHGEVWEDLPDDDGDGKFTNKSFWWSADHDLKEERRPTITLTGRRIDGQGSFKTGGPAGGGFRHDIGNFMLLGIEIPAGCWELTATYRDAELSYVVLIKG